MNTDLLTKVEAPHLKTITKVNVGDTVSVHTIIRDKKGEKKRVQVFTGLIISMKGSGSRAMFTVRKIGSAGIGVEKIMPMHSPNIEKIEVIKRGKVRRSKLYYLRERVGKLALKVKQAEFDPSAPIEMIQAPEIKKDDQAEETQVKDEKESAPDEKESKE